MKRELNQGMLTKNGVAARLVMNAMGAIILMDAPETWTKGVHTRKNFFRLNFCLNQNRTSTIAQNTKFNLN